MLNVTVQNVLGGWLRGNCIAGCFLGTPCTSWPRARRPALRNNFFIMGIPNQNEKDTVKLKIGNATMRQSANFLIRCHNLGIPCALENPAGSMMFKAPALKRVCNLADSRSICFDQCAFGARWRKRTRVQVWNIPDMQNDRSQFPVCCGKKGFCSHSGKRHIVLEGKDRVSGKPWTTLAQPYPKPLARKLALLLVSAQKELETIAFLRKCAA